MIQVDDFEVFFQANERRIHFQIQRLRVTDDWYGEFYSEGIVALWQAYRRYEPERGSVGTFLNYQIRFRLLDLLRKKLRDRERLEKVLEEEMSQLGDGNLRQDSGVRRLLVRAEEIPLANDLFWEVVWNELTERQWKWVQYFIIAELTVQEIAEIEGVSGEAVKSWGREVRRKLRDQEVLGRLEELV